jgi:hypothetical protein
VTRAGRRDWAFAVDAVARGDLLMLLDDEESARRPMTGGDRFWLVPSWQDEHRDAVAERWWPELSRAHAVPHDGPGIPVRTLCEVVAIHALDPTTRERIVRHHPWSPSHGQRSVRALVVRAWARPDAWLAELAWDGRWPQLTADPPEAALLPALTDEAFELHREQLLRDLEGADAARG